MHERASMNDERVRILSSLGATRNPVLLNRVIDLTFADFVRKQDRYRVLLGASGSAAGRRALWKFIQSRVDRLLEDLATTDLLSRVLKVSSWNNFQCHPIEDFLNFISVSF